MLIFFVFVPILFHFHVQEILTLPCQTPRLHAPPPTHSPSETTLQPCLRLQTSPSCRSPARRYRDAGDKSQGKGAGCERGQGQYLEAFLGDGAWLNPSLSHGEGGMCFPFTFPWRDQAWLWCWCWEEPAQRALAAGWDLPSPRRSQVPSCPSLFAALSVLVQTADEFELCQSCRCCTGQGMQRIHG